MRRVVFATLLIRPRPRLSALGRGEPIVSVGRAHRAPAARRPVEYVSVGSLGRYSVAGGGSLFPPCLRPFPPCGAQSPTHVPRSRRPPSSVRANAHPTGVRASVGRARPATLSHLRGLPSSLAFPPLRGFATLRPYANACPLPCGLRYAPPTPRKPACGEYVAASWCMVFPLAAGANHAECPFLSFLCLAAFARLGTAGRGHTMPKKGRACVLCCLVVIIPLRFAKYGRVDRLHIAYSSQYQCEDPYQQAIRELLRA